MLVTVVMVVRMAVLVVMIMIVVVMVVRMAVLVVMIMIVVVMVVMIMVVVIMVMFMMVMFVIVMMIVMMVPVLMSMVMVVLVSMVVVMVMLVTESVSMMVPMIVLMMVPMIVIMAVVVRMPMIVPVMVVVRLLVLVSVCELLQEFVLRLPLLQVRHRMADDDAQHVRLIRQVARAGAITDRFDDHRRNRRREFGGDPRGDAGSGRCRHLHPVRAWRDRQALHHFQRSRGRHRVQAVVDMDHARAERDRRADDLVRAERIERKGDADHVHDRINSADFMKMNTAHRDTVNFRLRRADFLENSEAVRLNPVIHVKPVDHLDDFRVMAVIVRRLIRIKDHVHLQSGHAALIYALPIERERLDLDFAQLVLDVVAVRACID
jgi:hypothetical protein